MLSNIIWFSTKTRLPPVCKPVLIPGNVAIWDGDIWRSALGGDYWKRIFVDVWAEMPSWYKRTDRPNNVEKICAEIIVLRQQLFQCMLLIDAIKGGKTCCKTLMADVQKAIQLVVDPGRGMV